MKALYFSEHGSTDKLIYSELPEPAPRRGEVLIKVEACALNHLDLWVLRGWEGLKLTMPHIGGADVSGTIAEIGAHVSGLSVGDEVVIQPGFATEEDEFTRSGDESLSPSYQIVGESRPGGFADYVVVPASSVFPKPKSLTFPEAASSLLVNLTAHRMLFKRAKLTKGQWVLIVGAGGGVNSASIMMAKSCGAKVFALSSSDNKLEKARKLGADEVLNYKEHPGWGKLVRQGIGGADVVVDNVGVTFNESLHALKRGGTLVTVGNTAGPKVQFDNRLVFAKQLSIVGSTMGGRDDFTKVLSLLEAKKITPIIDSELPLAKGRQAFEKLDRGEQFGKIVLIP